MDRKHRLPRVARAGLAALSGLLLASCANFNTINRTNALPSPAIKVETDGNGNRINYQVTQPAPHGMAIHLDAPQRLAYSNAFGQLCAEPSPDAIQAYAASLGASILTPNKFSADVAAALSGSTAGIGLRTQAITLMRDSLYRICEAYYNGALNPSDVVQMLQRSQDLTLGVLAIEQLTGTVAASQPMLTPGASASAARNTLNRSVDALEQAKKNEAARKSGLDAAKDARDKSKEAQKQSDADAATAKAKAAPVLAEIAKLRPQVAAEEAKLKPLDAAMNASKSVQEKQKSKVDDIQKALDAATGKKDQPEIDRLTKLHAAEKAQLDKDDAAFTQAKTSYDAQKSVLDPLQAALKKASSDNAPAEATKAAEAAATAKESVGKAETAVKEAEIEYKDAQAITEVRRADLANGTAAVQASATSGGAFALVSDRNNIDKDTAATIADATKSIVGMIINKGHLTDTCLNLLSANAQGKVKVSHDLLSICTKAVEAYLESYVAYSAMLKRQYEDYVPAPAPTQITPPPAQETPPSGSGDKSKNGTQGKGGKSPVSAPTPPTRFVLPPFLNPPAVASMPPRVAPPAPPPPPAPPRIQRAPDAPQMR